MSSEDILKLSEEIRKEALEKARGKFNKNGQINDVQNLSDVDIVDNPINIAETNENEGDIEKKYEDAWDKLSERRARALAQIEKNIDNPIFNIDLHLLEHADYSIPEEYASQIRQGEDKINQDLKKYAEKLLSEKQKSNADLNEAVGDISINIPHNEEKHELSSKTPEQKEIKRLEEDVERARKEYLEEDHKKKTAYRRVLDYFKKHNPKGDEHKHYEQDQDIAFYRATYDNSLMKLRDAKIAEAKSRNASDEELAGILAEFMFEQELKVQEVHDDVRAEHFDGKAFGFVRDAMLDLSKEYRSMSLKKKLAIGAGFAGIGLGAAQVAGIFAVSAGAIAATMAAKRAIMGSVLGVGLAEGLAEKNKRNKENEINETRDEFERMLSGMNEDEKYEFLSKMTWDIAIKDEKNSINEIKNKNLGHLAAGTLVGSLAGGLGMELIEKTGDYLSDTSLGKLLAGYFKNVSDYFDDNGASKAVADKPKVSTVNGSTSTEAKTSWSDSKANPKDPYPNAGNLSESQQATSGIAEKNISKGVEKNSSLNTTGDKISKVAPNGAMNAAEKAAVPVEALASMEGERIPIQKGDGIRDTLFKYLEKHHPEVKDREYVVTQMVRDFRHDNPGKNLDLVFNNNSLVINDHNGFHITSIEGNDNWGKGSLDQGTPSLESKNIPSRGIADANISSDIPTNETYKEWNSEIVDAASRADREKYEIASAVAKGEIPALDPNSPNFQENFNYAKSLQEAAASDVYNWAPSYEVGRLGEAMKNSREHMKLLLEMPDKETFTKIGRDFFDNKKSNILKFGNMNVREALSNPDENLKGLSEKARKLIIGYASSEQTMPKPNENFKLWSYRIMKLARKSTPSGSGNLDYFDPNGL